MQGVETGDYMAEKLRWSLRARDPKVTRAERRMAVQRLRAMHAQASQNYLLDYLQLHRVPGYRSFWISNVVFVPKASAELVATLAKRADVLRVRLNAVRATVDPPQRVGARPVPRVWSEVAQRELEWNLVKISADAAWQTTRGEGVTVANVDSGVRQTHEALSASYRGYRGEGVAPVHDYNWFDPKEFARDPWWCDPSWPLPDECRTDDPFDNTGHVRESRRREGAREIRAQARPRTNIPT